MQNIFVVALRDFLSKKFLALTLLPFFITFLIFGTLWNLSDIHVAVGQLTGIGFIDSLLNTVANFLAGFLGWILIAALSTVTATMIIGFFTPIIVKDIQKRHYPQVKLEGGVNIAQYLWLLFISFLKFLGVLVLSLIFYFIPILNYIAFHIPFYFLFTQLLSLDVGGEIFNKKELVEVLKKNRTKVYTTTLLLYLITLVPFAGMLLQVYFVAVLAHLFLRLKS